MVYLLVVVHVGIDVISKMEFSFETKNVHSSTYPWMMALQYMFVATMSVLRFIRLPQPYILPLC